MDLLIKYIAENPGQSSPEIFDGLNSIKKFDMSFATLKRRLTRLKKDNLITTVGQRRATRYSISVEYQFIKSITANEYFARENRETKDRFNFDLFEVLPNARIFTEEEIEELEELQEEYQANVAELSPEVYKHELERLSVDLTWKSSQIEGNTYSLLDTERLLREQKTADGKTVEEATMLLNHKKAIDFLIGNPDFFERLRVRDIEDIHSILIEKLDIKKGLRTELVGVGGTNYKPLDNEHQIREALTATCNLINSRENAFEKAILVLVLVSYIQAFMDGNKRTARLVANGILIANNFCPISFRTVESADYKKAMLIFYEQNNLSAFKEIFIEQFRFAVSEYFRLKNS
ncbi:MAG: Fic family protein [Crocinitomicaceae bacterium]|nr:Fic family protein [Crocinitomicaceae bacterium]